MEIDLQKSKEVFEALGEDRIQKKMCYNNIFRVFSSREFCTKFFDGEWKITYGFLQVGQLYIRHCAIYDSISGMSIDPTYYMLSVGKKEAKTEFLPMHIFNTSEEYLNAIWADKREPALYDYLQKIEDKFTNENSDKIFLD